VGAASVKSFEPIPCGANVENAGNDEDTRENYGLVWEKNIKCTEAKTYYLIGKSTRTGEFQQPQKFIEVMVYYVGLTENQS
jgi:hypothetical protein